MKKLLLFAVAMTLVVSCSDTKEDKATLSKTSYTLYHSQTEEVQGNFLNNIEWDSEDEFVATITDGVIEGQFVGKTTVRDNMYGLSFSVDVLPKYNQFTEPCKDWGASMETVRSRYGTPYLSDSESLTYITDDKNAPIYLYLFENGKLYGSSFVIPISVASTLADFLLERYLAYDVNMNKYTASFAHCYGKLSDPNIDYLVSFQYSSSIGGIIIAYVSTSINGTRANVQESIETILHKNGIKIE